MSACPYCAEPVAESDGKCKSCGEFLEDREPTHQSGGALKVVLIVLAVCVALGICLFVGAAFLVGSRVKVAQKQAMQARTQADMQALKSACSLYKMNLGYPPQQLSDLWNSPGDARWKGPYLATPNPSDPWGNAYIYSLQGNTPVFTSYGADGAPGGTGDAADITSGGP